MELLEGLSFPLYFNVILKLSGEKAKENNHCNVCSNTGFFPRQGGKGGGWGVAGKKVKREKIKLILTKILGNANSQESTCRA